MPRKQRTQGRVRPSVPTSCFAPLRWSGAASSRAGRSGAERGSPGAASGERAGRRAGSGQGLARKEEKGERERGAGRPGARAGRLRRLRPARARSAAAAPCRGQVLGVGNLSRPPVPPHKHPLKRGKPRRSDEDRRTKGR